MKIIFITREGYNLSGARVRCYGFAKRLQDYDIETEVFSFGDILGARYGEREFEMSVWKKFKFIYKAFDRLINENRESIFYIQRFNYHTFAPLLVHLFKKNRIIFDMDDWDMRENPVYYFGFYPSSKAEYLTREIAKQSVACIAASRYLFEYLSKFNKNVYYIPTGVDIEKFNPDLNKQNNRGIIFSWMGTIYHKEMFENVTFIIDCFYYLSNRYSHIKLEIVGEGKYFKEIKEIVDRRDTDGKIVIRDWIPPEQIPTYLSGVDIGLLPLIQNTKFNLAKSPTKLFEYMAMAKPVVASNLGEAEYIIQDGYNGFLAKDKQEFIEKMDELILNHRLRKDMGIWGRKTVEKHYSLGGLGRRIYEILQNT